MALLNQGRRRSAMKADYGFWLNLILVLYRGLGMFFCLALGFMCLQCLYELVFKSVGHLLKLSYKIGEDRNLTQFFGLFGLAAYYFYFSDYHRLYKVFPMMFNNDYSLLFSLIFILGVPVFFHKVLEVMFGFTSGRSEKVKLGFR